MLRPSTGNVLNLSILLVLCLIQYTAVAWIPTTTNNLLRLSLRTTRIHNARNRLYLSYRDDDSSEDDEEDDDEPPDVDISSFRPPTTSFGWNKGRSSPSQRKAMGRSGSSTARIHICSNCGSEFVKWMGRCPTCKEWNSLQEHVVVRQQKSSSRPVFGSSQQRPASWLDGVSADSNNNGPVRITDLCNEKEGSTQRSRQRIVIPKDDELNTVLGGGIMPGSLILVGGDPGVGKSTLLLQTAGSVASLATPTKGIGMGPLEDGDDKSLGPVWYVSGEENPGQIASRAARLGIKESELWLLSETHADTLCEQIVSHLSAVPTSDDFPRSKPPALVVIDSIQTMICDAGGFSAAGGVTQVRECVALFLRLSKTTNIPIFLVGHVTKTGDVAGPRTVEHMVDCVLYLEGTEQVGDGMNLRMLRASKNRFGSSDEVGVYEMTTGRLLPVSDPSSLFLAHRNNEDDAEGCVIATVLEGMRAMTVEVQALVTPAAGNSGFGRRTVHGIASSRLYLLMGVLQKRCGMFMARQDVYINIAGRIRLDHGEGNAADLAVAVAMVSSFSSIAVRSDTAFVGEVGLLGELRPVPAIEKRLQEARRMGFSRVITPRDRRKTIRKERSSKLSTSTVNGMEWVQCATLMDAITAGLVQPLPKRKRRRSSPKSDSPSTPGSLDELGLEEIMDDEDEDEDGFQ